MGVQQNVGWLRLFPEGYGIGAHVCFTEGKKLTCKMWKVFRLIGE
jgi:hypothetical protein